MSMLLSMLLFQFLSGSTAGDPLCSLLQTSFPLPFLDPKYGTVERNKHQVKNTVSSIPGLSIIKNNKVNKILDFNGCITRAYPAARS